MEINDLLGIPPESKTEATKAAIKGVSSFLEKVFKPGLEELGYIIKDEVRYWRLNNILSMLNLAKGKLDFDGKELNLTANARVGLAIMEECSSVDNEELQNLWAGLFAFPYLIQIFYLLENQEGFYKRGDFPTTIPQQFQLV